MPRRDDVKKVLIIGSGPIVIGQACEFDYSGTQACKALRKLGYQIVLVNSNPATIMTDPGMADVTYIESLDVETLTQIIAKERPDALLPNLGGQTGLNLSSDLARAGVLDRYGVRVIGVNLDAIKRGEDRETFKETMTKLGIGMPRSEIATTLEQAVAAAGRIGLPVVIRPAYTMGGTGGGFAYNMEEFEAIVSPRPHHQPGLAGPGRAVGPRLGGAGAGGGPRRDGPEDHRLLHRERGRHGGPHRRLLLHGADAHHLEGAAGPAPGRRLPDRGRHRGGRRDQRPVRPRSQDRSGGGHRDQPAHVALVGAGVEGDRLPDRAGLLDARRRAGALDEIPYWRDGTLDKYTPSGDYVVVKFARWAFEKFKGVQDKLGTQMRAVGEVMSIGKNYKEALQKAIRSLEIGRAGLGFAKDFHQRPLQELMDLLVDATSERQFILYEAIRKGADLQALYERTHIKPWFLQQMKELVELEEQVLAHRGTLPPAALLGQAKRDGFSDKYLAQLLQVTEQAVRERRIALGVVEAWEAVPVCGVENAAYYFSTYQAVKDVPVSGRRKVMVLGGGPNRIGQGIEFDYCCVHTALTLREAGFETIMVNCNPETVSTDYDTSDKLYFEPLTVEDVLSIYAKEKPEGVMVQFGGQTPLNIARQLEEAGVKIIGTTPETIDLAEDRERFSKVMTRLGIPQPESGLASTLDEALAVARRIGYPLIVRPSYVLGGRAMEVVHDEEMLAGVRPEGRAASHPSGPSTSTGSCRTRSRPRPTPSATGPRPSSRP